MSEIRWTEYEWERYHCMGNAASGKVVCRDCGTSVLDKAAHDVWHTRLEKRETK